MSFRVPMNRLRRTRIKFSINALCYLDIDLAALMAGLTYDPSGHEHRIYMSDGTRVELLIEETP